MKPTDHPDHKRVAGLIRQHAQKNPELKSLTFDRLLDHYLSNNPKDKAKLVRLVEGFAKDVYGDRIIET